MLPTATTTHRITAYDHSVDHSCASLCG